MERPGRQLLVALLLFVEAHQVQGHAIDGGPSWAGVDPRDQSRIAGEKPGIAGTNLRQKENAKAVAVFDRQEQIGRGRAGTNTRLESVVAPHTNDGVAIFVGVGEEFRTGQGEGHGAIGVAGEPTIAVGRRGVAVPFAGRIELARRAEIGKTRIAGGDEQVFDSVIAQLAGIAAILADKLAVAERRGAGTECKRGTQHQNHQETVVCPT